MVGLDDRLDDRKSEPGAAAATRSPALGPPEPLEQAVAGIRRQPRAVVADVDQRPLAFGGNGDLDRRARRCVVDRVAGQVREHLAKLRGIPEHAYRRAPANAGPPGWVRPP